MLILGAMNPAPATHAKSVCMLAAILAFVPAFAAAEVDPSESQLRGELQTLRPSFEHVVKSKKADAIREYEAKLEEAQPAKKTDVLKANLVHDPVVYPARVGIRR